MSRLEPPQCLCNDCRCIKRTVNKGRLCKTCLEQGHKVDQIKYGKISPYARRHIVAEPVVKVHGKRVHHRGRRNGVSML